MYEGVVRRRVARVSIDRRPILGMLFPIPVVCFLGALLTDLAYLGSGGNLIWVNFSSWLLAAGLLFGAIAGIFALIEAVRGATSWPAFGVFLVAWIVELINSFVHARDGWTAVAGLGLVLSIVGALLVLVAGWLNGVRVEAAR